MTTFLHRFFKTLGCALLASACISSVSATDAQNPWMNGLVVENPEIDYIPADYVGAFHFFTGVGYLDYMGVREWSSDYSIASHYLSMQGSLRYRSIPQNIGWEEYGYFDFWIEKRGGGLFDVNHIKLTTLREWDAVYYIAGYRDGVRVASFRIDEKPRSKKAASWVPSKLSFDVDIRNIDFLSITSDAGSDGTHSKIDSIEGVDHTASGTDRPWAYSEADVLVGPERIGTRSIMQDKLDKVYSGFVEAIRASFSIRAFTAGLHTATFTVTDKDGRYVGSFRWEEVLTSPGPAVAFADIDAGMLRMNHHEGPFNIESVVLTAPDGTASAASLPSREQIPFSRWNYHPGNMIGDMNDDGVINLADRAILMGFRNTETSFRDTGESRRHLYDRRDLSRITRKKDRDVYRKGDYEINLQDVLILQDIIRRQ